MLAAAAAGGSAVPAVTPPAAGNLVLVLDDNQRMRTAMESLLTHHGYRVKLYAKAAHFWGDGKPTEPACLLLENNLGKNITGPQIHAELQRRGWHLPTVFVSAFLDIRTVVKVMRDGADDFLVKPYAPMELVQAVAQALTRAAVRYHQDLLTADARTKAATLTARERQIVSLVIAGFNSSEIADQLNIAVITVKVNRSQAMRKLGAGNSASLAYLATLGGLLLTMTGTPTNGVMVVDSQ